MFPNKPYRIVATIEARMTSSRLPGKVLMPLGGKPALQLLIERLRQSHYLDEIVVATTTNSADEPIVELVKHLGAKFFRGSEDDVLARVLGAAESVQADLVVEITGDCPLMDPQLIDRGIEFFYTSLVDYAANIIQPTFPNGFDVQVFPTSVLKEVSTLTHDPIDRVHVSYYIYHHPERYRLLNWEAGPEEHAPELRVTLDEMADYQLLDTIVTHFNAEGKTMFTATDVVRYLRTNPQLLTINQHVPQKDPTRG